MFTPLMGPEARSTPSAGRSSAKGAPVSPSSKLGWLDFFIPVILTVGNYEDFIVKLGWGGDE